MGERIIRELAMQATTLVHW